jgi:hypothetical protein
MEKRLRNKIVDPKTLRGQDFVKQLSQRAMEQVRLSHEAGLDYVDVDLKNQANAEESAARDYRGRFLFELLQNASDAIADAKDRPEWRRDEYRVRIELTQTALVVANDGVPFLEKDVDSIFRWGETSKDPNKSIGYKGIGFKSVLEVTEAPEVFSRVVQFRFDRKTCYSEVRKIVGRQDNMKLPVTRFVFPYDVQRLPDPDRKLVRQLLEEDGFATVIRLPLKVEQDHVIGRVDEDIAPDLLLLLPGINRIEIRIAGREPRILDRIGAQAGAVSADGQDLVLRENGEWVGRWLLFDSPKRPINDRSIITSLKDQTWQRVHKVGFSVAFPLNAEGSLDLDSQTPEQVFVYFPTRERTGLRYRIHGDFYIDAARKQIGAIDYNLWLASAVASFVRNAVVPALTSRFPADPRIAQVFVPVGPGDDFGNRLRRLIEEELARCSFAASADGAYESPEHIMFAPQGAAVDISAFAQFFPQDQLSRRHGRRRFAAGQLEADAGAVEFLVRLGATQLTVDDVFVLLDGRPAVESQEQYPGFYAYLWRWREELKPDGRQGLSRALQRRGCVVIDDGSWITPHEQLYHAKLRAETPTMPRASKADLVHPSAYDAAGRDGPTYRLLDTLEPKVRDYDAPGIIRNAIIPLFDAGRFKDLPVVERREVYLYLYRYWQTRRGSGDPDVERVKGQVQVPARSLGNRRRDVWVRANQVYLSQYWSGDGRLEKLYDGLEDAAFLYQIRGLDLQPEEVKEWSRFWQWLGVANLPRVLVHELEPRQLAHLTWSNATRFHPHAGTQLWNQYVAMLRKEYGACSRHGGDYRRLARSVTVHGFAELVEQGQAEKLSLLYQLLAANWSVLHRQLQAAQLQCHRQDCPQYARSVEVQSFFDYLARNGRWIAARTETDGRPSPNLYQPRQCWSVAPSESAVIRNLLPAPVGDAARGEYASFDKYIGIRSIDQATCEDLVDLLRRLPEQYPDPNIAVSSGRRSVPRALATLTRWVAERINNMLAASDSPPPAPPDRIAIVAQQGETLRYVPPGEPVFFANDRYHWTRWRAHLPFAPLEDNWREAAHYLGLSFISEHVDESCDPGAELELESSRLEDRFKRARPYLLSVVNQQRSSAAADIARYLSSLRIRVVDTLIIHRRVTLPPGKWIDDAEAMIYLEKTFDRRTGSGGRAPRSGVLYVRKGFEDNFDLFGGPLADYIDVPTLADAFVILLERGGKDGRMRYLNMRGLAEGDVEEMRVQLATLGVIEEPEPEAGDGALDKHLLKQISQQHPADEGAPTTGSRATAVQQEDTNEEGGNDQEKPALDVIEFPEYDLDQVQVTAVGFQDGVLSAATSPATRRRSGGGMPNWERDQHLREAYGKRGEQIVRDLELRRLQDLTGAPAPRIYWLREQGNCTADHDLESKDLVDGEWVDIVIEVKATPSRDFRFPMSREELSCAQQAGGRYRLYRVIDVASATPQVFVFENPFSLWKEGRAHIEPRDTYVVLPDPRKQDGHVSSEINSETNRPLSS